MTYGISLGKLLFVQDPNVRLRVLAATAVRARASPPDSPSLSRGGKVNDPGVVAVFVASPRPPLLRRCVCRLLPP